LKGMIMSFLPGLKTVWADLLKIFSFATVWAPVAAVADPNAAESIQHATNVVTALQPVVQSVAAASATPLTHEQLVDAVTTAVTSSSNVLSNAGLVSADANARVQTLAPLVHAAVIASGAASTAPASPPPVVTP
jgi:hypothetical protein